MEDIEVLPEEKVLNDDSGKERVTSWKELEKVEKGLRESESEIPDEVQEMESDPDVVQNSSIENSNEPDMQNNADGDTKDVKDEEAVISEDIVKDNDSTDAQVRVKTAEDTHEAIIVEDAIKGEDDRGSEDEVELEDQVEAEDRPKLSHSCHNSHKKIIIDVDKSGFGNRMASLL